jgi:hypothetical protein
MSQFQSPKQLGFHLGHTHEDIANIIHKMFWHLTQHVIWNFKQDFGQAIAKAHGIVNVLFLKESHFVGSLFANEDAKVRIRLNVSVLIIDLPMRMRNVP